MRTLIFALFLSSTAYGDFMITDVCSDPAPRPFWATRPDGTMINDWFINGARPEDWRNHDGFDGNWGVVERGETYIIQNCQDTVLSVQGTQQHPSAATFVLDIWPETQLEPISPGVYRLVGITNRVGWVEVFSYEPDADRTSSIEFQVRGFVAPSVPEPSAAVLIGLAMVGFAGCRRLARQVALVSK